MKRMGVMCFLLFTILYTLLIGGYLTLVFHCVRPETIVMKIFLAMFVIIPLFVRSYMDEFVISITTRIISKNHFQRKVWDCNKKSKQDFLELLEEVSRGNKFPPLFVRNFMLNRIDEDERCESLIIRTKINNDYDILFV